MVIKRKLFSKEVERKKSDKGWDAALGELVLVLQLELLVK